MLVCHDKGEKFSGQTGPRDIKEMEYVTSTCSPPQGYSRDDTFSKVHPEPISGLSDAILASPELRRNQMWDIYLFHHQSISGFYGTSISLVPLKFIVEVYLEIPNVLLIS